MEKRYSILMFAPGFAPANNPEAIVNGKLALAFLNFGWDVDIITDKTEIAYKYTEEVDELWAPLNKCTYAIAPPIYRGLFRYLELLQCLLKMKHPINGLRWAYYAYMKSLSLINQKKYDFIISRAMPNNAHLPALLLSKKTNIPWIANWNDPHEEKAPHPWENVKSFSWIKKRYNSALIKHINWHTFPSDKMRTYMSNYLSEDIQQKSSIFPHIALNFKILSVQDPKYFTICCSGALYKGRDPSVLFSVLNELITESTDFKSVTRMYFMGIFGECLEEIIRKYRLQNYVTTISPMSYIKSLHFISKVDLLFLLETNYSDGIFLPSKMVDYYQVNRPILAMGAQKSEVQNILKSYGGGYYVPHTEKKMLKEVLKEIFCLWKENKLDTITAHSKLAEKFDPDAIVNKYNSLFHALLLKDKKCCKL